VVGCGGTQGGGGTVDIKPYEALIIEVADTASRGKKAFATLFADGVTVPDSDRKKYANYGFSVDSATADGNTAHLKILVVDIDGNDKGTVNWVAVKQGDKWKLKEAPLP